MTTIIHNVSRVTSAGSSEELAESHVNKTSRLELSKHQVATHRLSYLKHRLPLINDNTGVCSIPAVIAQRSKEQTTSTLHFIVVCHITYNVSRVTSAGSSEELAESHVSKLLGWQPWTPSHLWETWRELWKHQVATHRLSHLRYRLALNNDNRRVR
jgi:hypothetical protein